MSLQHKTITDHLRERLARIDFDRASLKSFTDLPVMSHGFFPGGNGLYEGEASTRFPVGGTLVLGSNFDRYANFVNAEGVLVIQDERSKTTWTRLLRLLEESGIDKHESFFTNGWPCLHEGESAVVTKLIPFWLKDDQLMRECLEFFNDTYAAMRPRLIVALGPGPAAFLGHVWSSTLGAWKANTITCLDLLPIGTVQLPGQDYKTVCTAITHPSGEHYNNAKYRKPPYQNREGEVLLLKHAHALSGQTIVHGT